MTFRKLTGQVHLWLGLATGLVVVIISITGCLYVFIDELKSVCYKDRLFVNAPQNTNRLPLSVLKDSAQKALGEKYPLQNAEIPTDKNSTIRFRTRKFNEKAVLYNNYIEYYYRVYVNPYTGKVVKLENTKWEFFNVVVNLHINLLLGHGVGGQIIAWSVLMFVILLISGIILWWPKNKEKMSRQFLFRWKDTTKWKRKNYDLHNIPGFYSMLFALIIALTGLVWAFKWVDTSMQWLANGGKSYEKPKPVFSDTTAVRSFSHLDAALESTRQKFPEATYFYMSLPQKPANPINVFVDFESSFAGATVKYDQHTGKLLETFTFSDKNNGEKMRALNYDIHTGMILKLPGKIIAFIASLVCASLPVTGFLIWWGRNNKKKKPKRTTVAKKKVEVL